MFSGDGVFDNIDRASSPASSDVSVSSGASSEYFSCFSESGSGVDSDVISVSSEESCPKRSSRTNNYKTRATTRKRTIRPRKRTATTYLPDIAKAKKSKQDYSVPYNSYSAPSSTFLPISRASLTHRRKKTTPVKFIPAVKDKQRTLMTKKSKYMQAPQQTFHFASRLNPVSNRGTDESNLRRSSRFSSDVSTTKSSRKYINIKWRTTKDYLQILTMDLEARYELNLD